MKVICPACSQPVEVIESCYNTLDIHYLAQGGTDGTCVVAVGDDPMSTWKIRSQQE